jgi:hypothetical protein
MGYYWDDYTGDFVYSEDDSDSGYQGVYDDYTGEFFMPDYSEEYGVQEVFPQQGQDFEGWRYFSDGTAISPEGAYYYQGSEEPIWSPSGGGGLGALGKSALNALMGAFKKSDGGVDWKKLATVGGGIAGLMGAGGTQQRPTGYQGGIPSYTAVRERVADTGAEGRRPGSGGERYFSDVVYAKPGEEAAARTTAQEQIASMVAQPAQQEPQEMAAGGIAGLKKGRYLNGATDGMADKIAATIDNKQPAALSHGEFVVPADVVSHLGNGNSEAGAKKLYEMMDKIRQARTGTKKQGKQIDPNKYLPA